MPAGGRPAPRGASAPDPSFDWVVAGRTWVGGRLQPVEVGITSEGWIVRVAKALCASRRVDLGESVLVPSGVDLHVHFREPGPPGAADSLETGTVQAVLGGIATVGEMPNTVPPADSVEALESKADRVRGRAACDVVLYGLAREARQVQRLGRTAGALKLYLAPTSGVDEPPELPSWPDLFGAVRATDLPLSVHAEDPALLRSDDPRLADLAGWNAARPPRAERASVDRLLSVAGATRLHVAHVTQASLAARIRSAGYSCEATPHHLLLSTRSRDIGTEGKVNPPLRDERTRAALWEAFAGGWPPILASDHAPHPPSAKERPMGLAPSGMPGVETMIPLLLQKVGRAELHLERLQAAVSERPARWFGLPMGRIAPGFRASFFVVDFRHRGRIRSRDLHAPAASSAFEGWEATFPRRHYVEGERVVDDREYVGRPLGRVVRPEYARGDRERPRGPA